MSQPLKQPRARKRFGQHFLTDEGVLQRIVDAMGLVSADRLLEIGPGPGALTSYLYGLTDHFAAVELDRDMIVPLTVRFPKLALTSADILRVDLDNLLEPAGWRLVGNLPYNISSPLLLKLYGHLDRIVDMHFMFQRELGARLAAIPGTKDWSRLSVMTQYHCEVESLFDVPPEAFSPPPRVHSQVVRLRPRTSAPAVDLTSLDQVLKAAFSARRKRIANGLKQLPVNWRATDVDPDLRPDSLSLEAFVELARALEPEEFNQPQASTKAGSAVPEDEE
ncbi:MAG: 16S rRNA (adenine(1518)-N(6)/adenine(1519)-N(6))-dimethyltransferase RsmA [Pseudomonadota bacterium]